VQRAVRLWGGYAPSPIFRLHLADGRRAVFKGMGQTGFENDVMRRALAAEERAYRELQPWIMPWAPACFGIYREADWHVVLLEDLGPQRIPPWTPDAITNALRSYAEFHTQSLGKALPEWLEPLHTAFGDGWRELEAEPGGLETLAAIGGEHEADAQTWLARNTPRLRATSELLASAPPPFALLHFDTRSDNLRLQDGARLRLFDWPFASVGPPELDTAAFAQSITVEGGPEPEAVMQHYTGPQREDVLDTVVAAVAGYFASRAWRPDIPGLPRLRPFQRQQLRVTLAWAARRLQLPAPFWLTSD
jgi:Phosphotransferase enzyme family